MRIIEFIQGYQRHQELNPKLWQGQTLDPKIKQSLLRIARAFEEFVDIGVPVVDVLITGGQVSYHYTEQSDLDLHLVIDYDRVECDQEVAELLDSKRLLFKQQHQIDLRGIPVEPGTEDLNNPSVSAAYSIVKDQWIRKPKNYGDQINDQEIKKQSLQWSKIIKAVLGQNDPETARKCLKLLRKYRKIGLKTSGEYGEANLVYKTLRNQGLVKDLADRVNQNLDRDLSVKEKGPR
jgi:hypothetical protein